MTTSGSAPGTSVNSRIDPLILRALTMVLSKAEAELADVDVRNLSVNLCLTLDLGRKNHWLEGSSLIELIDALVSLGSRCCSRL